MKIILPDDVKRIIGTLTANGYEAYAVGGCVRDSIIRRTPGDWDITTSAKPEQVKSLFRRTLDTGIQHGTVTVMFGHVGYEVTTYRVDGEYEDSRHPKSVEFTSSLLEDLKRRDFTINAMAYSDEKGIVDEFGGMNDLEKGVIKCVGNPKERFTEDALRMLRAVRFSAQLGFGIEEGTCEAIRELAPTIGRISSERIHTELGKTLLSPNPDYIDKAYRLGITAVVFPEYDSINDKDTVLRFLKKVPADISFRYAAILCEGSKKEAETALRRLKLDNATIRRVSSLVENHKLLPDTDERSIKRTAARIGLTEFRDVLAFEKAYYDVTCNRDMEEAVAGESGIFDMITKRGDCILVSDLAINGKDLIEMGIKPGREIGMILNRCLDEVIDNPGNNNREALMRFIHERIKL
ncbi:MAG: CCA tRNA nucleotidyltransferase [Butyrivibrio sp.]